jgi:hypothetical protein
MHLMGARTGVLHNGHPALDAAIHWTISSTNPVTTSNNPEIIKR